jgi:hypothetical protein
MKVTLNEVRYKGKPLFSRIVEHPNNNKMKTAVMAAVPKAQPLQMTSEQE